MSSRCQVDSPAFRGEAQRQNHRRYLAAPNGDSVHGLRGLFEVVVAALMFTLLLGASGEYGAMIVDVDADRREQRGDELVAATRDAISACSYESLAVLGGTWFTGTATPGASEFRIDLDVRRAENGKLRIQASLFDNRSSRVVSQFVTYRGRG